MIDSKYIAGPDITDLEIGIVSHMMRTGWYNYEYVELFQNEFAKYHNRTYGIMTPSCTTAIHLLLLALNVKKRDKVIVPDFTWIGSSAGVTYVGADTILVDISEENWCLDPALVEEYILASTKAIIVVDIYGNMPDMNQFEKLSKKYDIPLIEDAAEAIGSSYNSRLAGNFGLASVFSFHRTKTICTGEGGMILTNDANLYDRCMFLRDHGRKKDGKPYYNYEVTPKYMPSNLAASLGFAQLSRIDELIDKKRTIFNLYKENLRELEDIKLNIETPVSKNGSWLVALLIGKSYHIDKETMITLMQSKGITVRPFFYPLSSLPAYSKSVPNRFSNPVSYDIGNRGICLPSAFIITESQIVEVCNAIKEILNGRKRSI